MLFKCLLLKLFVFEYIYKFNSTVPIYRVKKVELHVYKMIFASTEDFSKSKALQLLRVLFFILNILILL